MEGDFELCDVSEDEPDMECGMESDEGIGHRKMRSRSILIVIPDEHDT